MVHQNHEDEKNHQVLRGGGTNHNLGSGGIRIALKQCGFKKIIRRIIFGHQPPSSYDFVFFTILNTSERHPHSR